jgi:type II secretory pathway predicted ATPase ExeA
VTDRLSSFYGFTRTPFGRSLAPAMLHRHTSHTEAAARIAWCIGEHGLGVITGEVGAGKTFALRAAVASLDPARHTVIYLPNPAVGMRGLHEAVVTALGRDAALPHVLADGPGQRRAGRRSRRTGQDADHRDR